jgi:uncharacterized protein (TIGR03435 family)
MTMQSVLISAAMFGSILVKASGAQIIATNSVPTEPRATFAVASVRENRSNSKPISNVPLDRGDSRLATGGLFSAHNQSLLSYIVFAYRVDVSETLGGFVRDLPQWVLSERFDIVARADSPAFTTNELRGMMQVLLENRFGLRTHREQRDFKGLGLALIRPSKMGLQLRRHDTASSCALQTGGLEQAASAEKVLGRWPATCGDGEQIRLLASPGVFRGGGRGMTMQAIGSWFTGEGDYDRPIFDVTGLTGTYDFIIDFRPEESEADQTEVESAQPTFIEALRDQLGLRLIPHNGKSSVFVVDHIDHLTPN